MVVVTESGSLTAELYAATVPPETVEWALEPPRLYFRSVPLASSGDALSLTVDDDLLDDYDVALYFVEHHQIHGTLTFRSGGDLAFVGLITFDANPSHDTGTPLVVRWTAPLTP